MFFSFSELENPNFKQNHIDEIVDSFNSLQCNSKSLILTIGEYHNYMDDNNKFISYTNKEHMEKTKRLKY